MGYLLFVSPLIVLVFCSYRTYSISEHPLLLIISFDGFRYNYFDRNLTPELLNLRVNGTYSKYMTSVFPTKTFPNHFSIATGMYVDVHGVLDNKVFDSSLNRYLTYSYELFHYNKDIVPIWTLNEKKGDGRHTGCMMWPGSNYEYQGTTIKHFQIYNESIKWKERVDRMISWFLDSEAPINLGMMYFEQPDLIMHTFGPDSPQLNQQLDRINLIVEYLIDRIKNSELLGKLNVIMLSDHGGQAVPYTHVIDLNDYLDNSTYSMYGVSPNLQIYPNPGKHDKVLNSLRKGAEESGHFFVFTRDEIHEQWHYKDSGRCPPIFIVADVSYVFNDLLVNIGKYKKKSPHIKDFSNSSFGTHGYDPLLENMRAFFMAFGPLIKHNHTVAPFVNIDLYPLFAELLDLELPLTKPNGSFIFVEDILNIKISESYTDTGPTVYIIAGVIIGALCLIVVISIILHLKRIESLKQRKSSLSSYRVLAGSEESSQNFEGSKLLVTSEFEDD